MIKDSKKSGSSARRRATSRPSAAASKRLILRFARINARLDTLDELLSEVGIAAPGWSSRERDPDEVIN